MRAAVLLAGVVAAMLAALPQRASERPFGFSDTGAARYAAIERRFLELPDADRVRDAHRFLTAQPHPAGSPRDRELAAWTAGRFRAAGMQDVRVIEHQVLLPRAESVSVEMTHPIAWAASMREDAAPGDADTTVDPGIVGVPHHAFSASGDVEAPVVFAGDGLPADYDWLAARGIDVRGRIVLVRLAVPYSYRGFKAMTAEARGAAAVLMYSDPAGDGAARGSTYPAGPWAPPSRIERGAIAYDFLGPGDPTTPGWPSIAGARRIPLTEAVTLPKIVSVPLSAADARPILESLGGPTAPGGWRGGLPVPYRVGPGPSRARVRVRMDDRVRPIWTVTGLFAGQEAPEEVVLVGNHRDAWIYGGVDPSSGSAALVELASSIGTLVKSGWTPRRSLLFASWDAEELALISSTEWGEQYAAWLRDRAVAYLNVDSAASGSRFAAAAVPSLARVIGEAAARVRDPLTRIPIAAAARDRAALDSSSAPLVRNRLGGGSDYAVFLNHLGIPVADLSFQGAYGVYHSIFDTHAFVARFGDPGFRHSTALVRLWGLVALRLADADVLPIDPSATVVALGTFLDELERDALPLLRDDGGRAAGAAMTSTREALDDLRRAVAAFDAAREAALSGNDLRAIADLSRHARLFERAFLDPDGLPGRPWYRHLVHAPRYTYEPEVLPGLRTGIAAGNARQFAEQTGRLTQALRRAAAVCRP